MVFMSWTSQRPQRMLWRHKKSTTTIPSGMKIWVPYLHKDFNICQKYLTKFHILLVPKHEIIFVPMHSCKSKRSPTNIITTNKTVQHPVLHYDLSGTVKTSLGGNIYFAHFFEPASAISEVKYEEEEWNHHESEKLNHTSWKGISFGTQEWPE